MEESSLWLGFRSLEWGKCVVAQAAGLERRGLCTRGKSAAWRIDARTEFGGRTNKKASGFRRWLEC